MLPTARNSDCQFWNVRLQKSGAARYSPHPRGALRSRIWSALKAVRPAMSWALHEPRKISPIVSPREWE